MILLLNIALPFTHTFLKSLHMSSESSDKENVKTERKDKDAKKRSKKRRKVYS
jgi:hypothetical protein